MQLKLAIPFGTTFDFFYKKAESKDIDKSGESGLSIIKTTEELCLELLLSNRVSAAVLTPLQYGKAVGKADMMIIPEIALFLKDYTRFASVAYAKNIRTIEKIASVNPEGYLTRIMQILLAERYSIHPFVEKIGRKENDTLKKYDAFVAWGDLADEEIVSDISEDWYEINQYPLPIGFWVCHSEEHPEGLEQKLFNLAEIGTGHIHIFEKDDESEKIFQRQGEISYKWNEESETALLYTLQMLYFHQFISEMPLVKLLGRD